MKRAYSTWIVLALVLVFVPSPGRGEEHSATRLSETEFVRNRELLLLKNQPWTGIPWQVSLTEARQRARKEQKPVFLVVNTGNCLGWT